MSLLLNVTRYCKVSTTYVYGVIVDYCYGNVYILLVFSPLHTTGLW